MQSRWARQHFVLLLALAGGAAAQTSSDSRISIYGYSEDAQHIRFTVQNNYSEPITFYQVRLQSLCSDGSAIDAGGWGLDTLFTRASEPDLGQFAPLQIERIEPGKPHPFEFPRSMGTEGCQPSTLKDFTVIFADGTAVGVSALIARQFFVWEWERRELKRWLDPFRELRLAQDPRAALSALREGLNRGYDDCEDRPLTDPKVVECQMNREIWHSVNRVWQQLRTSPAGETETVGSLARFWQRVADLLEKQLAHWNQA